LICADRSANRSIACASIRKCSFNAESVGELAGPSASRNGWIGLRVVGAESSSDGFSGNRLVARSIAIRVDRSLGVLVRILPDDDCKHDVNDSDEDTEAR
jgi:hypothetical protein